MTQKIVHVGAVFGSAVTLANEFEDIARDCSLPNEFESSSSMCAFLSALENMSDAEKDNIAVIFIDPAADIDNQLTEGELSQQVAGFKQGVLPTSDAIPALVNFLISKVQWGSKGAPKIFLFADPGIELQKGVEVLVDWTEDGVLVKKMEAALKTRMGINPAQSWHRGKEEDEE